GTGLGLSTVYGIVRQSEGHVEFYSEVGRGTTFHVYLPRVDADAAEPRAVPVEPRTLTGAETILLVEDDDAVRSFVRRTLRTHGYDVIDVSSAWDAAALFTSTMGAGIRLLLSDTILPDEAGPSLAARLLAHRSDLRVLFISGYTDETVTRLGL